VKPKYRLYCRSPHNRYGALEDRC